MAVDSNKRSSSIGRGDKARSDSKVKTDSKTTSKNAVDSRRSSSTSR